MAPRPNLFELGGFIANVNKPEAALVCVTLRKDKNIITIRKERDPFASARLRGVAEELPGNLERRRWRRRNRTDEGVRRCHRLLLDRRRRSRSNEYVPVRPSVFRFLKPLQLVNVQARFLYVERFEFRVRGGYTCKPGSFRPAAEIEHRRQYD